MISNIHSLEPWFDENTIDQNVNHAQLTVLHDYFIEDFKESTFQVNGKDVKIDFKLSKVKEYSSYSNTFFHIITRRSNAINDRYYECERANRIHWIKPILLAHPCNEIKYYKWRDDDGNCKEHFFYYHKRFMVVLKDIGPNTQVVTAFCVDEDEVAKYYERFVLFRDGKSGC